MRITVLAGGYGGAKFVRGLREHGKRNELGLDISVIANTADDIYVYGLKVCPDLDTLMYTLGGGLDEERGWGRLEESFTVKEELAAYGFAPDWFGLGDRDTATHLIRTQMLGAGYPLSAVTQALCDRWQPGVVLLPMSDDRVETHVVVDLDGTRTAMHFQEWWIRYRASLPAVEFLSIGADSASLGPGVLSAINEADVILLPPSNPVVSIGAILTVPGMRSALAGANAPIVGVSPIIGGAPVRGMADACLSAIGVECSWAGVASHYGARSDGGLLDGWVHDETDERLQAPAGIVHEAAPTLMTDVDSAVALAGRTLELARSMERPS